MTRYQPSPINGLAASKVHLPIGSWSTALDCLAAHFATITRAQWTDRVARGLVLNADGTSVTASTPYKAGLCIYYYREVADETPIPFTATILHADAHLIVVDKPHFLPVTPVGYYVRETVLTRLQQQLGNPELAPLHRIDRGTAGLVMFSASRTNRDAYQQLFRERRIEKRYLAIAPALPEHTFPLLRATRIVRGEPFVLSMEVSGVANTHTRIEVESREGDWWRYALYPTTGKKHQLRVHMAAVGAPIMNDDFYPTMTARLPSDFTKPLKLLAQRLSFVDPLSGQERHFESQLTL